MALNMESDPEFMRVRAILAENERLHAKIRELQLAQVSEQDVSDMRQQIVLLTEENAMLLKQSQAAGIAAERAAAESAELKKAHEQASLSLARARADLRTRDQELADRRRTGEDAAKRAAALEARLALKEEAIVRLEAELQEERRLGGAPHKPDAGADLAVQQYKDALAEMTSRRQVESAVLQARLTTAEESAHVAASLQRDLADARARIACLEAEISSARSQLAEATALHRTIDARRVQAECHLSALAVTAERAVGDRDAALAALTDTAHARDRAVAQARELAGRLERVTEQAARIEAEAAREVAEAVALIAEQSKAHQRHIAMLEHAPRASSHAGRHDRLKEASLIGDAPLL
eukprot:m.136262 g.136262  ORF g.136262 m.136262 type:complete len:354 (-) comp9550_c0_seq1:81-1142(-)